MVEPLPWWGRAVIGLIVIGVVVWVAILVRDDGLGDPEPADWQVAPDAAVGPSTRSVRVLVQERGCASGRSAEGRIRAEVDHRADAVVVSIGVRPYGGDQDCQGNPTTPYTLDLGEPLGDRPILGETSFP